VLHGSYQHAEAELMLLTLYNFSAKWCTASFGKLVVPNRNITSLFVLPFCVLLAFLTDLLLFCKLGVQTV
jgi:hypothetical protein